MNVSRIREQLQRYLQKDCGFSSPCWIWQGGKTPYGYGLLYADDRGHRAHRMAYMLARGDLQADLTIDHLCRQTSCINPEHLEQVTRSENARRQMILNAAAMGARRVLNRTACKSGHPYSSENTKFDKKGARVCVTCARKADRERNQRRSQNPEYRATRKAYLAAYHKRKQQETHAQRAPVIARMAQMKDGL